MESSLSTSGSFSRFQSGARYAADGRLEMRTETEGKLAKVPVRDFMHELFPEARQKYAGKELPHTFVDDLRLKLNIVPVKILPDDKDRENEMYEPLVDSMNWVATSASALDGTPTLEFKDAHGDWYSVTDSFQAMAPDIVAFSRDYPPTLKQWPWSSLYWEVKWGVEGDPILPDDKEDTENKVRKSTVGGSGNFFQTMDYARVQEHAAPRGFVFAVGIYGPTARFYRVDRAGIIVSESFNYKENPEILADFVIRFQSVSTEGRGYDATCLPVTDPVKVDRIRRISEHAKKERLTVDADLFVERSVRIHLPGETSDQEGEWFLSIGPPVFTSTSLLGSGTRAWLVVKDGEGTHDEAYFIIKDAWRQDKRKSEGAKYKALYERKPKDNGPPVNQKAKENGHVFGVARLRRDVDLVQGDDDIFGATVSQKWFEGRRRVHHRTGLNSVGIHLTRFNSTAEAIDAIKDGTVGHWGMCARRMLHRDMSIDNIMISYKPEDEYGALGFVIDLDYAADLDDMDKEDNLRDMTGTFQFLSVNRKFGGSKPHEEYHDMESIYWVIIYLMLRHAKTNLIIENASRLLDAVPGDKRDFFTTDVKDMVMDRNPALERLIKRHSKLVHKHHGSIDIYLTTDEDDPFFQMAAGFLQSRSCLTHPKFIDIITQERSQPDGWPKTGDSARPWKMLSAGSRRTRDDRPGYFHPSRSSGLDGRKRPIFHVEQQAGGSDSKRQRQ